MSYSSKLIMQWVCIVLSACQFLLISLSCGLGVENSLLSLNYLEGLKYLTMGVSLLSTFGLLFRKSRRIASLVQIALLLGSIFNHLQSDQFFEMLISIGIIGICTIILWLEQEKQYAPTQ